MRIFRDCTQESAQSIVRLRVPALIKLGIALQCIGMNASGHDSIKKISTKTTAPAGTIYVTDAPYNADPSGSTDSSEAIQAAILAAQPNASTVVMPLGIYRINSSINMKALSEFTAVSLVGDVLSIARTHDPVEIARMRNNWIVVKNATGMSHHTSDLPDRPTLYLPPSTIGYGNISNPGYVVHLWRADFSDPEDLHPNGNFNQELRNIDIVVGTGNPGVVALRNRGAQGSDVFNVSIFLPNSMGTGIQGLPGSGGLTWGVTVYGGRVGLDLRGTQPSTLVSGATLFNQSCAAVIYSGQQTLTLVGANISYNPTIGGSAISIPIGGNGSICSASGGLPPDPGSHPGPAHANGQIIIADSFITYDSSAQVQHEATCSHISSGASVVLRRVFAKGCKTIIKFTCCATIPAPVTVNTSLWVQIETAAICVLPFPTSSSDQPNIRNGSLQFHVPLYLPYRVNSTDRLIVISNDSLTPTSEFLVQHFPKTDAAELTWLSWGFSNSVILTDFGGVGDGTHDCISAFEHAISAITNRGLSSGVIIVPQGQFMVSRTIVFPDVPIAVVGISVRQTVISASSNRSFSGPVIQTGKATFVLRDIHVLYFKHQQLAFGIEWNGAAYSLMSQVQVRRDCYDVPSVLTLHGHGHHGAPLVNCVHPFTVVANATLASVLWKGSGYLFGLIPINKAFDWNASKLNESRLDVAPGYRDLLFVGATDTRCYMLDPETPHSPIHAIFDAHVEVRNSTRVFNYGSKSEGPIPVMWIRDSHNISMLGYGGLGTPPPLNVGYLPGLADFPPSLFRVSGDCTGIELAQLMNRPQSPADTNPHMADPLSWSMLVFDTIPSLPLDRPTYFRLD